MLAINAAVVGLNRTATREGDPSRLPDVEIRTAKGGGHSQDTSLKWVHTDAGDVLSPRALLPLPMTSRCTCISRTSSPSVWRGGIRR